MSVTRDAGARTGWISDANEIPVAVVADALGLKVEGRAVGPCPACSAEQRGSKDRRLPVGLRPDGKGWRCLRCDASGDSVGLASRVLVGASGRDVEPYRWPEVRAWFAQLPADIRLARLPDPESADSDRPPLDELRAVWQISEAVTSSPAAIAWLKSRGLDPECVAAGNLARVLPDARVLPYWAMFGDTCWSMSYAFPLVVRMYAASGKCESLHARSLALKPPPTKSVSPAGYRIAGTVMADPVGVKMLAGRTQPARVVVAEGEPDWLSLATEQAREDTAILGIVSGSWSDDIASRVPDGARVLVFTDHDEAGDAYAMKIYRSLSGRCPVHRSNVR